MKPISPLSWSVIQNRTKEIGIRKVLGATSVDILNLLTISFKKGIAVAFLIAAPVAYYLMSQWLTRFVPGSLDFCGLGADYGCRFGANP